MGCGGCVQCSPFPRRILADPMTPSPPGPSGIAPPSRFDSWQLQWQRFAATTVRAYHAYGSWLVSISWRRFIVLAMGLLIGVAIVHDKPPFTWTYTEDVEPARPRIVLRPPKAVPAQPAQSQEAPQAAQEPAAADKGSAGAAISIPGIHIETPEADEGVDINIGKEGIRIVPKAHRGSSPASAASAAAAAASLAQNGLQIALPPGEASQFVRQAVEQARQQVAESVRQAREEAAAAKREAQQAREETANAIDELNEAQDAQPRTRTTRVGIGEVMMQFTLLWVIASAILKFTYKGRLQAEVKAAQATETAEAESLRRQVVEARMAAMQAQVEPHFLFNTLASIDHLIETDPARASVMQKNLIALLRASMPTMREASGNGSGNGSLGVRDLARELAVIRPYLEILKVRMEERLTTSIDVPDGLVSAEFPPMMIQTLVENAIKHGLEPKPEGGTLRLKAEIVHGKLQVTVADTGLGFGMAATAGTGVGLANIRERLQLLYGPKASLTVAANTPSGTVVTITVPYRTVEGAGA
jgi:hypothetical protein